MLNILIGRAGSGKSTRMLRSFCQWGGGRPQLYLVPEQYSHETERRLCQVGGSAASGYGEVLSFTRLANRVFSVTGGLAEPVLDGGGRLLLMHRALRSVESQLTVYSRPSRRAAFLEGLMGTADELKSYCVTPAQLVEAGTDTGGQEGDKLRDLGLIFSAYDALVAQRAADPRDRLTRLRDALVKTPVLSGYDIYIDNFVDFTPQEQGVLSQLLKQAHSVTIAITCSPLEEAPLSQFEPCRRTVHTLRRLAKEAGCPAEVVTVADFPGGKAAELAFLEGALQTADETLQPWPQPTDALLLAVGDTPIQQVEFAAGQLVRLAREKGWRWREMGVTARSLEGWEDEIEVVFRRWNIPVFLSRMTDILQKPVLALITAALDSITGGYSYDDLFRYLKTGLTGLEPEQRDLLENYVLQWDIRGRKWAQEEPWSWNPAGYTENWSESDRALVAELDELRRQVIAPLEHLRSRPEETGKGRAMALYDFLEEIDLRGRLTARAEELTVEGELNQAEEYRQLWDVLCGALEQCAWLLEEKTLELTEFSQLFQLVLSQYDVGSIPVALDRVTVGDAPRMAHKNLKALIVLGAEDGAFPQSAQGAGLLTDDDRALLTGYGMRLAPNQEARLEREWTILYEMVAAPSQLLMVCRSNQSAGGEEQRPSVLFTRLEGLFPENTVLHMGEWLERGRLTAPQPALDTLAETRSQELFQALDGLPETSLQARRLRRSFDLTRGSLSPAGVRSLYGERVRLSASRMDKLKSCHFSYFMEYGLKANVRKKAGFLAPEAGTFVHDVLENVLKNARELGGVHQCSEDTIRTLTRQAVEDYITRELGGLDRYPQRFRYLFQRLVKSVDLVVENVVEELRSGQFEPIDFELGFGSGSGIPVEVQCGDLTLSITGFVDRVDGWYHDGKLYYRVVDYKTGKKSFDFTDVWNGLGLQMLVYLFTLREKGEAVFQCDQPVPAGVLYLPAREVMVSGSREMGEEARRTLADKALKRSGLLLNDTGVLEAMEETTSTSPRFLPIRVSKGGKISGDALASMAQLGQLQRHVERVLQQIGREFAAGDVDADPYYKGEQLSACKWCDYANACHFEEGQGNDCRRYLAKVSKKTFWEGLDKMDEKEG